MAHNSRETPHSPRSTFYPTPCLLCIKENVQVLDNPNVKCLPDNCEKLC
jgi:hypothetical protein